MGNSFLVNASLGTTISVLNIELHVLIFFGPY